MFRNGSRLKHSSAFKTFSSLIENLSFEIPSLATNRNVCLASKFKKLNIQKWKIHKLSAAQIGILLVPCLVWRHARACDVFLLFSKIQRFCADTFVLDLSCAWEASLPLLYTSKASKRIIYIFPLQIFFLKLPPLSQCSMLPDQLPLPINIWEDVVTHSTLR